MLEKFGMWLGERTPFYTFVKFIVIICVRLFFGIRIEGTQHIPPTGRLIVAANHITSYDPPVLGMCVTRQVDFMAKKELFENPAMAGLLRGLHVFPVDREKTDMSAIKEALRRLKAERAVGIFIQGTRNSGDAEALNGAAFLAQRSDAPVLPAAIWREGKRFCIAFDAPLRAQSKSKADMEALTDTIMGRINAMIPKKELV